MRTGDDSKVHLSYTHYHSSAVVFVRANVSMIKD